jgi:flavodoxin/ferredoxin
MKSIVIYFSQTGSTQKVAKAIHKGMERDSDQCDLAKMKSMDAGCLVDYDLIAIGSPVWGGVPLNVRFFLNSAPALNGKHAIAFCTHGALPELFFPQAMALIKKKGMILIGMNDWYGSVFRPTLPKPYFTDGHPDEVDQREAEEFGRQMVALSRSIYAGESQHIPVFPEMPVPPPSNLPRPMPTLVQEKCRFPKCRLCVDHCPVEDIDLEASPPRFARNCTSCFFCEMICPSGAIHIDYEARSKISLDRVEELFIKHLAQAEAAGRFRRLVPLEKIDPKTPFYKIFNQHPRYVIPKDE